MASPRSERPTERTPLLPHRRRTSASVDHAEVDAPRICTFAAGITLEHLPTYNVDYLYPRIPTSRPARVSFALCVLLYYRKSIASGVASRGRDVWTQWQDTVQYDAGVRNLDSLIARVWGQFLDDDSTEEEVAEVLWSAHLVDEYSLNTLRVVDFLACGDVPQDLLSHPLILLSLNDTWKYGRYPNYVEDGIATTLVRFIDSCCTPRVLHVLDFASHLVYLVALHQYLTRPPTTGSIATFDLRRTLLLVIASSKLFRPWSYSTIPPALLFIAFLSCLPDAPAIVDLSFAVLQLVFFWEVLNLHFPTHPSPLFLYSPQQILPLSMLAKQSISWLPVPAAFFIPALFASLVMFSESFTNMRFVLYAPRSFTIEAPLDTQINFFALFCTFFLFVWLALAYSVLVHPFLAASVGPKPSPWDRYTTPAFLSAVTVYGTPHYFPGPLNLVQIVAVSIPTLLFLTPRTRRSAARMAVVEKILWRILMSGRKRLAKKGTQPPAKRRKTDSRPDDHIPTPQSQVNAPSAAALSERALPPAHVPSLSTICIRVFAERIRELSGKPAVWENVRLWLKELPDALIQRVFATLRHTCPTLLQHGFIVAYFLRGSSIVLSDDLPGVGRLTIFAIGDIPTRNQLLELELTGFSKIADDVFATVVSKLPALRRLNLRGCTKVGLKTAQAMAKHCLDLEYVNLNYTSVPPVALVPLFSNCKLQFLKAAGIPNWLWNALAEENDFDFTRLRGLKLRQTALTSAVLIPVLLACSNLERLDLSFTPVKRPPAPSAHLLEKLVLTSTMLSTTELLALVSPLRKLKVLAIGALGEGQGTSAAISNTSVMTLTDDALRSLTDILEDCPDLERVNLVGNTKLGFAGRRGPDSALSYFVRRVGRRCKQLNLANIPSLRSFHLEGLAHPDGVDEGPPQLLHLNLNNTSVDDTAAPYLSACVHLQTLELAGTKFTSAGLFPMIDACERLEKLDLTSCRGVRVGDRRRFFEVWEEEWKNT
ncbi:RNI-like protein [Trametes elegans]|nr:RNI-like protein [Trametes elegans]